MVTLNLKEELRKLSAEHRKQLMLAFEQEIPCHVVVRGDVFVGVHLIVNGNFEVIEEQEPWSCGYVRS